MSNPNQRKQIQLMINKQKQMPQLQVKQKPQILSTYKQFWKRNLQQNKGMPSGNKLLKYNYKQSIQKMQEKVVHQRSFNSYHQDEQDCLRVCTEERSEDSTGKDITEDFEGYRRTRRFFVKSDLTYLQKERNTACSSQIIFNQSCHNFRAASLGKNIFDFEEKDKRPQTLSKFQRKSSHKSTEKQNTSLNPYTKGQYLYVRNQSKDQEAKKRVMNQSKFNFGKNIQQSCKIISFVLVNPLEKYQKMEKMHKTNSTLPECCLDDEQSLARFKLQSKQMPISHRKKSSYLQNKRAHTKATTANSQKTFLAEDFEPTPWESTSKNCELFYLKVQEL